MDAVRLSTRNLGNIYIGALIAFPFVLFGLYKYFNVRFRTYHVAVVIWPALFILLDLHFSKRRKIGNVRQENNKTKFINNISLALISFVFIMSKNQGPGPNQGPGKMKSSTKLMYLALLLIFATIVPTPDTDCRTAESIYIQAVQRALLNYAFLIFMLSVLSMYEGY